jgi:hypothetical protein
VANFTFIYRSLLHYKKAKSGMLLTRNHGQLKNVIETIIEKEIQRKSLMRRIESSDMFEFVDEKVQSGGRSAQLYKAKKDVNMAHFERNLSV